MIQTKLKLVHYKQILLDKLKTDTDNPTNRQIKDWTDTHIRPKKLISVMEKEGLIKIDIVQEGKTIRRIITPLINQIHTLYES